MKFQKERCSELVNKILRRSHKLFLALLQIGESPNRLALVSLERDLEEYFQYANISVRINLTLWYSILQQIHEGLSDFCSRGVFKWLVDRGASKLDEYNRMIDDFKDDTVVSLQVSVPFRIELRCVILAHYTGSDRDKSECRCATSLICSATVGLISPQTMQLNLL